VKVQSDKIMQAVILAAGLGRRIGPSSNSIPKCLLEVNGKRILGHQLDSLRSCGVQDIVVVVGYLRDKIRDFLGPAVGYVENPAYADSNSSYSLWLAKDRLVGDFIYLNADLIFDGAILKTLLDHPAENAITIDSSRLKFEDDMFKVSLKYGRVIELNKRLDAQKAAASAPGPVKFSRRGRDVLFDELDRIIGHGDRSQWCYSIFGRIAQRIDLRGVDISGLPWIEIDTDEDLDQARRMRFVIG
jgi:choline kinase